MIDTKIENCNNELLEDQKNNLINDILCGYNPNYFKIVDIEAGCRKTRTAEKALAQLITTTNKNAIFVRLNDDDCQESADKINAIIGEESAFVYNNKVVAQKERIAVQKDFPKYRILIITHKKYLILAENKSQRSIFTKNRSVLVIDEFVSDVKKLTLNRVDINTFKLLFAYDMEILSLYLKIVSSLDDYATSYPIGRYFARITPNFQAKEVHLLIKYIKNNMTNDTLKARIHDVLLQNTDNINSELLSKTTSVKQVCNFIDNIKEFYKQLCIIDNGTFYTTDSKCKHWLLDNNIMLDASGTLQSVYNMNRELYRLENNEKVLDHSKWNLINIVANTTTSSKGRMTNFYEVVNQTIKKYGVNETLVISNKNDIDNITCVPDEHKGYFGNLTGSNKWANLSNVVIVQTPNINDIDYILQYIHYSKEYIDDKITTWASKSTGRGTKTRYEFTDKRFEKIRTLWIAEQTYQAIKRVNRNMKYVTNAVIFMNNPDVIDLLKENLKGCNIQTVEENEIKCLWTKQDEYVTELQKNSYATKFVELLAELENGKHSDLLYRNKKGNVVYGTYAKKTIREYLRINNATTFSNKVLSKTQVVTYCRTRDISTSGQYIKLNCYIAETA